MRRNLTKDGSLSFARNPAALRFNPNHDEIGQFSTAENAVTPQDITDATAAVETEMSGLSDESKRQAIKMRAQSIAASRTIKDFLATATITENLSDRILAIYAPISSSMADIDPAAKQVIEARVAEIAANGVEDRLREVLIGGTFGDVVDGRFIVRPGSESQGEDAARTFAYLATSDEWLGDVNRTIREGALATADRDNLIGIINPDNPETAILLGVKSASEAREVLSNFSQGRLALAAEITGFVGMRGLTMNPTQKAVFDPNTSVDLQLREAGGWATDPGVGTLTFRVTGGGGLDPDFGTYSEREQLDEIANFIGTPASITVKPTLDTVVKGYGQRYKLLAQDALDGSDRPSAMRRLANYDTYISSNANVARAGVYNPSSGEYEKVQEADSGSILGTYDRPLKDSDPFPYYDTGFAAGPGGTRFLRTVALSRYETLAEKRGIDPKFRGSNSKGFSKSVWGDWLNNIASPQTTEFRNATATEFGLPIAITFEESEVDKDSPRFKALRVFARAQWETTQYALNRQYEGEKKAGRNPKPYLELYRGIIVPQKTLTKAQEIKSDHPGVYSATFPEVFTVLPAYQHRRNGMSSWTSNNEVANNWKGNDGNYDPSNNFRARVVIRAKVPFANVLSYPPFGNNVANEAEHVLTSAPANSWVAFKDEAPTSGEWDESEHPRGPDGRFIEKFGSRSFALRFNQNHDELGRFAFSDASGTTEGSGENHAGLTGLNPLDPRRGSKFSSPSKWRNKSAEGTPLTLDIGNWRSDEFIDDSSDGVQIARAILADVAAMPNLPPGALPLGPGVLGGATPAMMWLEASRKIADDLREALKVTDQSPWDGSLPQTDSFDPFATNAQMKYIFRYASGDVLEALKKSPITVAKEPVEGGRSYYSDIENKIGLSYDVAAGLSEGRRDAVATFAHEFGHWIEHHVPNAAELASDFVIKRSAKAQRRVGDGTVKEYSLQDVESMPYSDEEKFLPDHFRAYYTGKIYYDSPETHKLAREGKVRGQKLLTEVVSMGIQYLVDDPVAFATQDPEHFAFTVNILRGKSIKWKKGTTPKPKSPRKPRRSLDETRDIRLEILGSIASAFAFTINTRTYRSRDD